MLRDMESFKMSPNITDYVTYGRLLAAFGETGNFGIHAGGQDGDPYVLLSAGFGDGSYITRRTIPGGPFTTLTIGTRIAPDYLGNITSILALDLVHNLTHVSVGFNGEIGSIIVSNSTGIILQTAPGQFPINALFHCEVQFTIGTGTSGSVIVRVQEIQKVNLQNVNTQNGGRGVIDTTRHIVAGSGSCKVQHIYWADTTGPYNNAFLGDRRVYGGLPTAAGDTTQLTPVGGLTNFSNAGLAPPAPSTNYNVGGTVGNEDLYRVSSPTGVTGVNGAMVSAITHKDDSGPKSFAILLKSGGVIATGASIPQADGPTTQSDIFEVDPSNNLPIIPSALPLLQPGGKVSA
jgi:hypothetical protein